METGERIKESYQRALAYYNSKTPAHIITTKDSWYNGYIIGVDEYHIEILDKVTGKQKINFVDIDVFEEYIGPLDKLPIPKEDF